jgi:hypothetical protein
MSNRYVEEYWRDTSCELLPKLYSADFKMLSRQNGAFKKPRYIAAITTQAIIKHTTRYGIQVELYLVLAKLFWWCAI